MCLFLFIAPTTTAAAVASLDGSTYLLKNQVLNKFLAVVESHDQDEHQYRLSLTSGLSTDQDNGMSSIQWKFVPSLNHHGYYHIQHVTTGLCLDVSIHNSNLINLTASSLSTLSTSSPSSPSLSSEKNTHLWQPIYCDDSRISFKLINKYLQHTTQRSIYLTSSTPSSHNNDGDNDCNDNIDNVMYNSSNDHNLLSIWNLQVNRDDDDVAPPLTGLFTHSKGNLYVYIYIYEPLIIITYVLDDIYNCKIEILVAAFLIITAYLSDIYSSLQ